MPEFFAMASRDELWSRGALVETRLTHGQAHQSGTEIVASDAFDDRRLRDELRRACDAGGTIRGDIARLTDARIRMVTTATYGGSVSVQTTIVVTIADVSVVTTPQNLSSDHAALARLLAPAATRTPDRPWPIVWRNGSGAVLLHEAAGHAAEHQHPPLSWPRWLRARDEAAAGSADLLAGELPRAVRRESFRDVPLPRMTSVKVEQDRAPFELPTRRIEVHLVSGGAYEPLTESVTIRVAIADLVQNDRPRRLTPFTIRASRQAIARALVGAQGRPQRYPGVICSREGQELFVASHAPLLLMAELA
jgi:hypothetical protein